MWDFSQMEKNNIIRLYDTSIRWHLQEDILKFDERTDAMIRELPKSEDRGGEKVNIEAHDGRGAAVDKRLYCYQRAGTAETRVQREDDMLLRNA